MTPNNEKMFGHPGQYLSHQQTQLSIAQDRYSVPFIDLNLLEDLTGCGKRLDKDRLLVGYSDPGTRWRFSVGSERNSAKVPSRLRIPKTERSGQWVLRPRQQKVQAPQEQLISPTTLRPPQSGSLLSSTTPTNS